MSLSGVSINDLPCSCKVRYELRATEELRRLDYHYEKTTTFLWKNCEVISGKEEEEEDSLGSLVFKLFACDEQEKPRVTNPFSAWHACSTPQKHDERQSYLQRTRSPKQFLKADARDLIAEFPRSSSATEPSNETKFLRRGILTQETRAKSDTVIKTYPERQDGDFHRQKLSPHSSLKFYHFDKPTDYMKYYNDRVTSSNIRSHIQIRLQQNAARKTVTVSKKEKPNRVCNAKNTYYRFRVSTGKDINTNTEYGILRVGACDPRAKPMERLEIDCTKGGKMKGGRVLIQPRPPVQKMIVGKAAKIATMYDIKDTSKCKERSSVLNARLLGSIAKPSGHTTRSKQSRPCTNVKLKVCDSVPNPPASLHYQMTKHAMANTNKTKPKIFPKKNTSEIPRKLPHKQTLGEKEFLHITTPMPISKNHVGSSVVLNGESPSHTPTMSTYRNLLKSPSFVEYATIPRNVNELFLNRESQAAIPKNCHFRACITPSNYSRSSISNQLKEKREPGQDDEATSYADEQLFPSNEQESRKIHRVSSRPSVPQIGPFISG